MTRQARPVKVTRGSLTRALRLVQGYLRAVGQTHSYHCEAVQRHRPTVWALFWSFSMFSENLTVSPRGLVVLLTNFSREELGLDYSSVLASQAHRLQLTSCTRLASSFDCRYGVKAPHPHRLIHTSSTALQMCILPFWSKIELGRTMGSNNGIILCCCPRRG